MHAPTRRGVLGTPRVAGERHRGTCTADTDRLWVVGADGEHDDVGVALAQLRREQLVPVVHVETGEPGADPPVVVPVDLPGAAEHETEAITRHPVEGVATHPHLHPPAVHQRPGGVWPAADAEVDGVADCCGAAEHHDALRVVLGQLADERIGQTAGGREQHGRTRWRAAAALPPRASTMPSLDVRNTVLAPAG